MTYCGSLRYALNNHNYYVEAKFYMKFQEAIEFHELSTVLKFAIYVMLLMFRIYHKKNKKKTTFSLIDRDARGDNRMKNLHNKYCTIVAVVF